MGLESNNIGRRVLLTLSADWTNRQESQWMEVLVEPLKIQKRPPFGYRFLILEIICGYRIFKTYLRD